MPFLLVLRKTWIAFRHLVQSKRRRRQRSFFFSVAILGSLVLLQTKHMHTVSTTPETVYSLNHGQAIEDSAPSLTWEFHGYSQSNIPARSTSPSIPRLLIAQYASAFYTVVLNETQRVNQAYAERFNHDFIVCRGIYLTDSPWWRLVSPPLHTIAGSRSTYNKIAVLAYAMQHDYDRVLILDSDAMVRDFSINLATYSLTDDKGKDVVVVAQQAKMGEVHPPNTWNVNIGVTLWNLRHEQVVTVWQQWHDRSIARIRSGQADDDQQPLQRCFRAFPDTTRPVLAVKEFGYGGGSIVQHFIRESSSSWSEPTEARTEGIRTAARKIVPK